MDTPTYAALKRIVSITRYIYEDEEPNGDVMKDVERLEVWVDEVAKDHKYADATE